MLMFQTEPATNGKPKRRRKNERPSSSGMLYFILAFIGGLLLFAGIGAIWLRVAPPDLPFLSGKNPKPMTTTTHITAARFTSENRFSVAVYITDDEGALQSVSLAVVKPDLESVTTMGFPAELKLPDSDTDTLARRFATGGIEAAQPALSAYLGKSVDYYMVMSYANAEAFFTATKESLVINLPKDVDQQDGNFSLHLSEGEHALSPKQVANFLRCDNWQGGRRERANMHATAVSAYINQFLTKHHKIEEDYADWMKLCQSNLHSERFEIEEPALNYLANLGKDPLCFTTYIDGTFEGAGEFLRFAPNTATVENFVYDMK